MAPLSPTPTPELGCRRSECQGYELVANLDFDTNGAVAVDDNDPYWEDGYGWIPVGYPENPFNTTFDGNGHTIASLYTRWTEVGYVGFFRATGEGAVIGNLGLTDIDVTGGADRVGGIVGDSAGAIANSYTTGRVSGGKTTRELQLPTGPTGIYANWNPNHWDFGTSRQYPALKYDGLSVAAQRQ